MQTVEEIAKSIVAREGGFVNDPDDPGGATNHGVTIHTLRRLGLDVNRDGAVNLADVQELTQDQATEIFITHYFHKPKIAQLPSPLQPSVFDMYVTRRNYYFGLADQRPASRKYARTRAGKKGGWIKRAEEFMSPRYHLSIRDFNERVAAWG